jgi:hypothetical protein
MQHPDEIAETFEKHTCNIRDIATVTYAKIKMKHLQLRLKQLKHLKHTLATHVYSYTTYATSDLLLLKHMKYISETYA